MAGGGAGGGLARPTPDMKKQNSTAHKIEMGFELVIGNSPPASVVSAGLLTYLNLDCRPSDRAEPLPTKVDGTK